MRSPYLLTEITTKAKAVKESLRCNQPLAKASTEYMKNEVAVESMKTKRPRSVLLMAGLMCLAAGCVERRVEYVPVYRAQTGSQAQPQYGQQTLYQPQPGTVVTPPTN